MFRRQLTSIALCFFSILIAAYCSVTVQAQSGRRQQKPLSAAPVPTPTPEPTPTPKKNQDDSKLVFVVGMYRGDVLFNYPVSFYDIVQGECAERLRQGSSATVEMVDNSMNRAEAYKKAKSETTANVVWLQLSSDDLRGTGNQSYDSIQIEFVVFAPGTGKTITSGRGYLSSKRKGPLVIGRGPTGSNNVMYIDQLLKLAAQDVADRILDALNLTAPTIPNLRD